MLLVGGIRRRKEHPSLNVGWMDREDFAARLRKGGDREDVATPWRQVEVETRRDQIVPIAIVVGGTQQIFETHGAVGQIRPWETDVALALVPGIVDRDECPLAAAPLPAPGDAAVARPVAVPSRHAVEEAPLAVQDGRTAEDCQQIFVEPPQSFINGFPRGPDQLSRDTLLLT